MSWKPEVQTVRDGPWDGNALRFATEAEAREYVLDLMMRWSSVRDTRQIEVDEPVNYRMVNGKARPIGKDAPIVNASGHAVGIRTVVFDEDGAHDLGTVAPENVGDVLKGLLGE